VNTGGAVRGERQPSLLGLGAAAGQGQADAVPVAPVGPQGEDGALGVRHARALPPHGPRPRAGG